MVFESGAYDPVRRVLERAHRGRAGLRARAAARGPGRHDLRRARRDRRTSCRRSRSSTRTSSCEGRTIVDTISDNAAMGAMVLGGTPVTRRRRRPALGLRAALAATQTSRSRASRPPCSATRPTASPGSRTSSPSTAPSLEAGEIILAGSFTRPIWVERGDTVHADYRELGTIDMPIRMTPRRRSRRRWRPPTARWSGMWVSARAARWSPRSARAAASTGVLIDAEHGPNGLDVDPRRSCRRVAGYPVTPLVRPPIGDTVLIKQYLELGVQNLLIPMVDTRRAGRRARARRALPAARRARGRQRARPLVALEPGRRTTSRTPATRSRSIVQIESATAVEQRRGDPGGRRRRRHLRRPRRPGGLDGAPRAAGPSGCRRRRRAAASRLARAAGKPAGVNAFDPALADRYIAAGRLVRLRRRRRPAPRRAAPRSLADPASSTRAERNDRRRSTAPARSSPCTSTTARAPRSAAARPAHPSYFLKPASSVAATGDALERPAGTELLAFEGEIALVIGTPRRRVTPERRLGRGLGRHRGQRLRASTTCAPPTAARTCARRAATASRRSGPAVIPAAGLDPAGLRVRTWVNGELVQDDTTDTLLFPFGQLVADLSQLLTLEPGDVILTGTPAGSSVVVPGRRRRGRGRRPAATGAPSTGRLVTPIAEGTVAVRRRRREARASTTRSASRRGAIARDGRPGAAGSPLRLTDELRAQLRSRRASPP